MELRNDVQGIGEELGYEGVERLVAEVGQICNHERERIRLVNEPKIIALRAEVALWAEEDKRLSERLRLAPPAGDRSSRRLKAYIAGAVALALMIAGFFLSLLALAPFRLGTYAYLFCLGIALVCPYCVERCLEEWGCRKLVRVLATVACVVAIASLVLLAEIRGKLFVQELADTQSEVVIQDTGSDAPQSGFRFYQQAVPLLELMMSLLAVAMELGAGLAFHDAKRFGIDSGEDAEQIAEKRIELRHRLASLIGQSVACENEAAAFEARFWRDFYRAMLTRGVKKALGKMLALFLCAAIFGVATLRADQPRLNLVISIDLSASVSTKGPDGTTDFQKNVAAVKDLLGQVPAGTKLTILGITGNSFEEPDILLRARVSDDAGYFGERLSSAHRQLVRAWQKQTVSLKPNAKETDILGALLVASQIFAQAPNATNKILVIYSDMRQATPELNFERRKVIQIDQAIQECRTHALIPNMRGIHVYVLGVDAARENAGEWNNIRRFWRSYFEAAGATENAYSLLRNSPAI